MMGLATAHLAQVLVDDRRHAAAASFSRHAVATDHVLAGAHARQRRNVALSLLLVNRSGGR